MPKENLPVHNSVTPHPFYQHTHNATHLDGLVTHTPGSEPTPFHCGTQNVKKGENDVHNALSNYYLDVDVNDNSELSPISSLFPEL